MKKKQNFRIVFMGTPDFAVPSLQALVEAGYCIAGVVTAPDKPQGRGLKLQSPPVKMYAVQHELALFQPINLKSDDFFNQLAALNADLFVVVAFRMLPERIWAMPASGTINLHASLLPHYRGAAPINWAIIFGEQTTGVTTFFIERNIDTGNIIMQQSLDIGADETAGQLHDSLMHLGAGLLLKTVDAIRQGKSGAIEQNTMIPDPSCLKNAPKIHKADCFINWMQSSENIHNFIRGLSPHPGAFTTLVSPEGEKTDVKIYKSEVPAVVEQVPAKILFTDQKQTRLFVKTSDSCLEILELQLPGKNRMGASEFLRGYKIGEKWTIA